jgi:hypothetical protein
MTLVNPVACCSLVAGAHIHCGASGMNGVVAFLISLWTVVCLHPLGGLWRPGRLQYCECRLRLYHRHALREH